MPPDTNNLLFFSSEDSQVMEVEPVSWGFNNRLKTVGVLGTVPELADCPLLMCIKRSVALPVTDALPLPEGERFRLCHRIRVRFGQGSGPGTGSSHWGYRPC